MATIAALAKRRNKALARIEQLLGMGVGVIPRLHRDKELLRVIQLETIAKALTPEILEVMDLYEDTVDLPVMSNEVTAQDLLAELGN
jgi:hypothetical protein